MPTTDNFNSDLNEEDTIEVTPEVTPAPVNTIPEIVLAPVVKNDDVAKEANRRRMRHLGF